MHIQLRQQLARNEWLKQLATASRSRLIDTAKIHQFHAGQRLHSKHSEAEGLYCVIDGEIKISATNAAGAEILFTRILAGQCFGEIAILDGGLRTHDAHAISASHVAILPRTIVRAVTDDDLDAYRALVHLLCTHCRQAFHALDDFLFLSPAQLLAKRLLDLAAQSQTPNEVLISQQELGELVGISRQSIHRILKTWEQEGLIQRHYAGVVIRRGDALSLLFEKST